MGKRIAATVRAATVEDLQDLMRQQGLSCESAEQAMEQYAAAVTAGWVFLAIVNDVCVGTAMYHPSGNFHTLVHERYRRRGIGTKLAKALQASVGEARWANMRLQVPSKEEVSHFFLRALGFRATCVRRRYAEDGDDCYEMRYQPERPVKPTSGPADTKGGSDAPRVD